MLLVQPKGTAGGNCYQCTVPNIFEFRVDKFEKYINLFYLNVLNHYPLLSHNSKTNKYNSIQGNDILVTVFGPYAGYCLK